MSFTRRKFTKRVIIASACFILLCTVICGIVAFVSTPEYVTGTLVAKCSECNHEIQVELPSGRTQTWEVTESAYECLDIGELVTRSRDGGISVG